MTTADVFRIVRVLGHKDVCIWKLDIVDGYVPAVNNFLRYVTIRSFQWKFYLFPFYFHFWGNHLTKSIKGC